MLTLRTTVVVGCLLATLTAHLQAQSEIRWIQDWRQARDLAQQEHRLVLLHFWSENCAPCLNLERQVFNRPDVARAIHAAYVPVKINVDHDRQLANHYRVESWPTDIIVDAKGQVIHRQTSPPEANQYIALLDGVKAHHAVAMSSQQPAAPHTVAPARPGHVEQAAQSPKQVDPRNSSYSSGFHATTTPASTPAVNPLLAQHGSQQAPVGGPYANPYLSNTGPGNPAASAPEAGAATNLYSQRQATGQEHRNQMHRGAPTTNRYSAGPISNANQPWNNWSDQGARQATATQVTERPPLPQQSSVLGLESYCPVTLVEKNIWSKGDVRWGAVHRGRTYLFTNAANQQRFLADPDAFAPVLSGYDPVRYVDQGEVVDGRRKHGLYYGNNYFLFASEDALQRFQSNPTRYIPDGAISQ